MTLYSKQPVSNQPVSNRAAIAITVITILCVAAWRASVVAARTRRSQAVLQELATIRQFKQDLALSSDGGRLIYCQETEKGVGMYFYNAASGRTKLLCEQDEKKGARQRFSMLGWAPDDSLFAYAFPANPKKKLEEIIICDGTSGEVVTNIAADLNLHGLAWLTPRSFVYSDYSKNLFLFEQKQGRKWARAKKFRRDDPERQLSLTATSASSVAWQEGGDIWALDIRGGEYQKIWESTPTNQLVEFTYSRQAKEFLLNCSDENGQFLIRYNPAPKWKNDAGRIGSKESPIKGVTWTDNGPSYVYLSNVGGPNTFYVKAGTNSELTHLVWEGGVRNYTLKEDRLYIVGNLSNQPPAIWEYNLHSGEMNPIVSSSKQALNDTEIAHVEGEITNTLGEKRTYHLWKPEKISAEKKYPIIIAQELNTWFSCARIAPSIGYYFGIVDQPSSYHLGPSTWREDVMGLYATLAKNPNIDTNRVYLYATSAKTGFLSPLIEEKPGLWKGAILFSPIALPELSLFHNKRMLIVAGRNDGDGKVAEWLTKYQDKGAAMGIPINLVFLKNSAHVTQSAGAEREREEKFERFLSED